MKQFYGIVFSARNIGGDKIIGNIGGEMVPVIPRGHDTETEGSLLPNFGACIGMNKLRTL